MLCLIELAICRSRSLSISSCLLPLQDEDNAHRKMRLRIEEVQGRACLTNFHGMTFTTDKIRSLVRKWQSLIEVRACGHVLLFLVGSMCS